MFAPPRFDRTLNLIRMLREGGGGAMLLVEGDTDSRLLRPFFLPNAIQIAGSRDNVLRICATLSTELPGIVGLVDADNIGPADPASGAPNVILTDDRDIEVVCMATPALERVVGEHVSAAKARHLAGDGSLFSRVIEATRPLGLLRSINHRDGLGLDFDGIQHAKLLSRDSWKVDPEKAVEVLVQRSKAGIGRAVLSQRLRDLDRDSIASRAVVKGRDAIAVLAVILKALGATAASAEGLERELRVAFDREAFLQTEVFRRIRAWENQSTWQVLL